MQGFKSLISPLSSTLMRHCEVDLGLQVPRCQAGGQAAVSQAEGGAAAELGRSGGRDVWNRFVRVVEVL